MAGFKALSAGAKAALLAGGAAVVGLAGYGGWTYSKSPVAEPTVAQGEGAVVVAAAPPATAPIKPVVSDPVAEPAAAAIPAVDEPAVVAAPAASPDQPTEVAPIAPSFDVVRVEPDGSTVVAGRAEPGSKIILRVDGAEISATTADANGNFVGLLMLESSATPRMLTMTSILPDNSEVPAVAEVALAPTQSPPVVVAASPEPAPSDTAVASAEPAATTPAEPAAPLAEAPAALLITKDGVTVLQSGETAAADGPAPTLTIDTISYTPAGDVQLAGHGAPNSFVRVYLDNAPLIDVNAAESGLWASTMPPIAPGIYTLRVDQLAADGSVSARFETPFKRETPEALALAAKPAAPDASVVASAEEAPPVALAPAIATTEVATATPDAAAVPAVAADAPPTLEPAAAPASTVASDDGGQVKAVATAPISITVQPGFTLWGIASQQFGDGVMYVQVFEANKDKIRDPDLIYPGQVFVIPTASK